MLGWKKIKIMSITLRFEMLIFFIIQPLFGNLSIKDANDNHCQVKFAHLT